MNHRYRLRNLVSIAIVCLISVHFMWGQALMTVTPASPTKNVGEPFTLTVHLAGVSNLLASRVTLTFDNSIIQYTGAAAPGGFFPPDGSGGFFASNPPPGPAVASVVINEAVIGVPTLNGEGDLFTIGFTAIAPGSVAVGVAASMRDSLNGLIPTTVSGATVTVNYPVPTTSDISPTTKNAGEADFSLTVNGTNLYGTSVVRLNGSDKATTFVSATQVTAAITAADIATGGLKNITVFNPAPGGGESNARVLTVNHIITASAGANGSISPSGAVPVAPGTDQTFTITPAVGHHITDVLVDGGSIGPVTAHTFNAVAANHTIAATFAINQYTLTYIAGANGTISGTSPQTVNWGGSGTQVTAVPNAGYHFVDWSDASTSNPRTDINVIGNISVTANFAINTYTLTYIAGANGTISGTSPQTVNWGGSGTQVTAVPNAGYHFVDWSDASTTNPRTDINVTGNISVTANFAINTYTLTYIAGANGTISGTSPQTVNWGGSGTQVTAVPNTGYHFVNWSDASTTNPRTDFNVTGNISVTANFAINTYTLTYTAGANGTISGTTPQTVSWGGNGTQVTAVPNTGYHFVSWSDGVLTAARTDNNVTADVTVTATFAVNQYTLTYTAGANGTISGTSLQTVSWGGSGTAVTAVPNAGYHFVNWSDASTSNPRTDANVTGNISVTANFTINTYMLTYTAGSGGTISGTSPQTVNWGGSGTAVTALPNTGYHFINWSDGSAANPRTDTGVTENISVTANFAVNTYTITPSVGTPGHGTISPGTPQTVVFGGSQSFTITPNTNYHVADVKVDGASVGAVTSYTFTGVVADHTIEAIFAPTLQYTVTGADSLGMDTNGDGTVDMTMKFTSIPYGTWHVNVSLYVGNPAGQPAGPAGSLACYLQCTTDMPAHSFSVNVKRAMTDVSGFGGTSNMVYYRDTAPVGWVLTPCRYTDSELPWMGIPTLAFTADHFTDFTLFNAPSKNVFLAVNGTTAVAGTAFPNNTWVAGGYGPDDWRWTGSQTLSFYLLPELNSVFNSGDVTLEWDNSIMTFANAEFTGIAFTTSTATPVGSNQLQIHVASAVDITVNPLAYIVRLNFSLLKPGHSALAVIQSDFSKSGSQVVYLIPHQGEVKTYLGDVATGFDGTTGNGAVDFNDLSLWSISYWSGVPGFPGGMTNYKRKFDIGPTLDGYVFSLPQPDSKIEFEDLVMFSISYGQSRSHQLPKLPATSKDPVEVSLGKPVVAGNETRIPLVVGGSVADIRAMKIGVEGTFGSYIGADKGDVLNSYETPVTIMSRADGRKVFVDLAVMGLNAPGIDRSGDLVWLRFTGAPAVRLTASDARNSLNAPLNVLKKRGEGEAVPTAYALQQNYPNPFNPTTTIAYAVPVSGHVTLEVYNLLGQKVATLVNDVQDAGFYQVVWDGRGENQNSVATGIYLYRVRSGEFVSVKKMLLVK